MGRTADLKIFAGNSNPPLAAEISQYLKVSLGKATVDTFSDGESKVEIKENVRGADVFVLQSTSAPGNNNLMELLLMLDAFKRSAQRITAVMPYYGYARQDRKVVPRVPISAKLVADLITRAGASRMLTMDLHSGQIQGFFDIPVDNVYATPVLLDYLRKQLNRNEVTIVSPDAGGVERARAIATRLMHRWQSLTNAGRTQRCCRDEHYRESEGSHRHPGRRYDRYCWNLDHGCRGAQKRGREENHRLLLTPGVVRTGDQTHRRIPA
jgi:ribose-phosphate pyrophosphokinase